MSYEFSITDEPEYIRVEVSGVRPPDVDKGLADVMQVWARVAERCRATRQKRVLAVLRLTGEVPIMGSYGVVTRADEFGWSRSFRLAVVDLNEESRRGNSFTETVAFNLGYPVCVFATESEAKAWLLDGDMRQD